MFDNASIMGFYKIEKVNKETGEKELLFEGKNHITDAFKEFLLSYASNVYNMGNFKKGAVNGGVTYRNSVINNGNSNLYYIGGALKLYGLDNIIANPETLTEYPFLNIDGTIDDTHITFIGDDYITGLKYAEVVPTQNINLLIPHTISKSWKLTGPNGQGNIKTLCIGADPTQVVKANSGKVLAQSYMNYSNQMVNILSYLPPLPTVNEGKFLFGSDRTPNVDSTFLSYDINTDSYTNIGATSPLHKFPLAPLWANVVTDGDYIYMPNASGYTYKYDIANNTLTYLIGRSYHNIFKKGNYLLLNPYSYTKGGGDSGRTGQTLYVYDFSGNADSTLFGATSINTNTYTLNKPTGFVCTGIGTRNDNGNYLVYDNYLAWCIECTDLTDVLGSAVASYNTRNLNNITINNKLYFLFDYYNQVSSSNSISNEYTANNEGYSAGNMTGALDSNYDSVLMISNPENNRNMYSIITNIKDVNGNDVVQGEDTELLFTYTLRIV